MMSPTLKKFFQSWLINTLAVLVAVYIIKGIHYERPLDLVIASFLLGMLNAFLRPVLLLLSLPLLIFTLGLFTLVINATLLYFVGFLLKPHFYVENFSSAFWGALIISLVGLFLNSVTGAGSSRITIRRGKSSSSNRGDGGGPVIDV